MPHMFPASPRNWRSRRHPRTWVARRGVSRSLRYRRTVSRRPGPVALAGRLRLPRLGAVEDTPCRAARRLRPRMPFSMCSRGHSVGAASSLSGDPVGWCRTPRRVATNRYGLQDGGTGSGSPWHEWLVEHPNDLHRVFSKQVQALDTGTRHAPPKMTEEGMRAAS